MQFNKHTEWEDLGLKVLVSVTHDTTFLPPSSASLSPSLPLITHIHSVTESLLSNAPPKCAFFTAHYHPWLQISKHYVPVLSQEQEFLYHRLHPTSSALQSITARPISLKYPFIHVITLLELFKGFPLPMKAFPKSRFLEY